MFEQLLKRLFLNKFLLISTTISLAILVIILLLSNKNPNTLSNAPEPLPSSNSPLSGFTNLTEEKVNNASKYRSLVQDRFPIYIKEYKTSVDITTSIHIYYLSDDDPSIMRLEIYGISYLNKNELDPKKNPNIQAFQESFQQALKLITEVGVDPQQFIFLYGDKDYVHNTATYWVDKLGLLR